MRNQNYQEELPTGIKYLRAICGLLIFLGIFYLFLFFIYFFGFAASLRNLSIFSIIDTNLKKDLILVITTTIVAYLIYKGLGEKKYWGWLIAIIGFGIIFINNLISINLTFLPMNILYLWYLYIRRDFFKTKRIVKDKKFLKEEKIFKYLFWIFIILNLITSFL